ncbi:MAG: GntR family transcriptional regulator [Pseudomonadota bacterium]
MTLHKTSDMISKTVETETGKNISQTQRATAILREMIMNNRLPAGSSHLESELAEMLDMSRTPVREATLVLEAQGLVEVRPRRGIRILPLAAQDMAEIYQILTELEGLAAESAARRDLAPDEIYAVETVLEEMETALESDDREAWASADERFHDLLVNLSGNRRLTMAVNAYNDQVHRARLLTLRLRPLPLQSNADHREVFEAIKEGDGKRARRIHTAHRTRAMKLITELLAQHGFHQV